MDYFHREIEQQKAAGRRARRTRLRGDKLNWPLALAAALLLLVSAAIWLSR